MSTFSYNLLYGLNSAVGIVMLALTGSWIKKYQLGFNWQDNQFNYHPFFMILGLVFLYSQSILIYRTGRYMISKKSLKWVHTIIHLMAFIFSVVALKAVFDSHRKMNYENLYSIHSWIGLITVIIFAAQFLCGFVAFLFPGLPGHLRKTIMPHHIFIGTIAFIMAIMATVSGITEVAMYMIDYSSLPPEAYYINFMGLFAVLYGALTLYLLTKTEYKRIPLAED